MHRLITRLSCASVTLLSACGQSNSNPGPAPEPIVTARYDGTTPNGLMLSRDGYLYGTTFTGGDFGYGTVFRVSPDGVETVLHSFGRGSDDGANPKGLIQASDGDFYGTTTNGGISNCVRVTIQLAGPPGKYTDSSGCGVLYRINARGEVTILHYFAGGADGQHPIPTLVEVDNGVFYGATDTGGIVNGLCGTDGCGVTFRITTAGVKSTVHSFDASNGDGSHPIGLTFGTDGILYGTTLVGGAQNQGTVFSLSPGGIYTILHSFGGQGSGDAGYPYGSLVEGRDGNFYGASRYGGIGRLDLCESGCGTLYRITPAGAETVVYVFTETTNGALPEGTLIAASDGNLYGLTSYGGAGWGVIFKSTLTGVESVVHQFGQPPPNVFDSPVPSGLVRSLSGNLYGIAAGGDFAEGVVYKLDQQGELTILHSFRGR